MTPNELKALEDSLWEAADQLRANSKLTATEYSMPVLGLIFLRHATNRFLDVKAAIEKDLPKRGGVTRALTPDDFKRKAALYLPAESTYGHIASLPGQVDLGKAINDAMEAIEVHTPMLRGQLPKDYVQFDKDLLQRLVRVFDREVLRRATGDVFGRIYEYFLNKFAMSGAQEGGEFFTPPSLVRTIVNVIEPNHGVVFDPACGSAGMLVQSGWFITAQEHNPGEVARFLGQEKSETNTKLAKMNLAVHGLEGEIQVGNTFYERRMELVEGCDFVMANPPFNVDGVDYSKVKDDPRLFTKRKVPGVTKKSGDKGAEGTKKARKGKGDGTSAEAGGEAVNNANFLWIQYFRSYLKSGAGRAGFVMAASASDAGHGEMEIRKELIQSGDVDVMVAIGTNFFYTRTLPCTLWFLDRGKPKERRDQVLMLDARAVYHVVNRRIRDFTDEQLANLTAIVWLYRGASARYLGLVQRWLDEVKAAIEEAPARVEKVDAKVQAFTERLATFARDLKARGDADPDAVELLREQNEALATDAMAWVGERARVLGQLAAWGKGWDKAGKARATNLGQRGHGESLEGLMPALRDVQKQLQELDKAIGKALGHAEKDLGGKQDPLWENRAAKSDLEQLEAARHEAADAMKRVAYFAAQVHWLQSRFPDGVVAEVPGLCKVVTLADIEAQGWSLTPGRYVGAGTVEDQGDELASRLMEIRAELSELNSSATRLADEIANQLGSLLE